MTGFRHTQAELIHRHFARRLERDESPSRRNSVSLRRCDSLPPHRVITTECPLGLDFQLSSRWRKRVGAAIENLSQEQQHVLGWPAAESILRKIAACTIHVREHRQFLEPSLLPVDTGEDIRQLSLTDAAGLTDLHRQCPSVQQQQADINIEHPAVFAHFVGPMMTAVASAIEESPDVFDIGVLVRPKFRRRGLGCRVVSAVARWIFQQSAAAQYCFDEQNLASAQLARRLHGQAYAVITHWNLR